MKRFTLFPVSILVLAIAAGCHGQVPPNPTVSVCPVPSGSNYTPLNASNPASGTTYTDSKPPAGVRCYISQATIGSQVSSWSNVVQLTLSGTNSALLTSTPGTGPTPTGYIYSEAAAVSTTLGAPAITNGSVAMANPATPKPVTVATNTPSLTASVH